MTSSWLAFEILTTLHNLEYNLAYMVRSSFEYCIFVTVWVDRINIEQPKTKASKHTIRNYNVSILHTISVCIQLFRWTDSESSIVCHSMGQGEGQTVHRPTYAGGTGRVYSGYLRCIGNETSLLQCPEPFRAHMFCGHDEDVVVQCGKSLKNILPCLPCILRTNLQFHTLLRYLCINVYVSARM